MTTHTPLPARNSNPVHEHARPGNTGPRSETTRPRPERGQPALFQPLTLRSVTMRNRVWMAPMCQYSAVTSSAHERGLAGDWHLVHLGSRAVGGAGLVMAEATAVSAEGRISPQDLGLWSRVQADALAPVTAFLREHGAVPAVQLAHAGRKASVSAPWDGGRPIRPSVGGWPVLGPSAVPFEGLHTPQSMTRGDLDRFLGDVARSTELAVHAGFQVVELHAAHGYLLHEFLSPLSNRRTDDYGGTLAGRARLLLEAVDAVRSRWPEHLPLLVRISATDWSDGGWDIDQSVELAGLLAARGVDLVDVSTGGNVPAHIPVEPGYQVPFAQRIRAEAGVPVSAVGLITEPEQAERVVADGHADAVMLGRSLLADPYWPLRAARELGADTARLAPPQYARAL